VKPNQIYDLLKQKIIWLELAPESALNISELADTFKVSRTPIKEALIYLQAQGWVLRQGSHFLVTPLSLDRIREITEIRMNLEVQGNIWAMQRISLQEMEKLKALKIEMMALDENAENRQMIELDFKFHRIIFQATRNNQLAEILERQLSQYFRFWLSIPRQIDRRQFFAEFMELLEAFQNKNEKAVRRCTENHIRNSVAEIMGSR
jgi:DNA-binding GntR family transcriptional regulator